MSVDSGVMAIRPVVLFDLDGTLLDSFGSIGDMIDAMLADAGHVPCDRMALRRMIGAPLDEVIQTAPLPSYGASPRKSLQRPPP